MPYVAAYARWTRDWFSVEYSCRSVEPRTYSAAGTNASIIPVLSLDGISRGDFMIPRASRRRLAYRVDCKRPMTAVTKSLGTLSDVLGASGLRRTGLYSLRALSPARYRRRDAGSQPFG